jgi:6-pyruvoyltetrahydropterin/6-carboxytetrahydropterin synthase
MMYSVAVRRDFIANHFLTGGDWGPENEIHAHHYVVETRFDGPQLDRHGYLLDICEIEAALDALVEQYRDKTLNRLAVFEGLNPSLEHFARIIWQSIADQRQSSNLESMTVKIWENEIAWASYTKAL